MIFLFRQLLVIFLIFVIYFFHLIIRSLNLKVDQALQQQVIKFPKKNIGASIEEWVVSQFVFTNILFILLLSNLIDIKNNFPKWAKIYSILITISISLGLINYLLELPILDLSKEIPEVLGRVFRGLYFILAYFHLIRPSFFVFRIYHTFCLVNFLCFLLFILLFIFTL